MIMANRPQIVTVTMVGHWPSGLPLHIKNLSWALAAFTHETYVVTTPEIKAAYEGMLPNVHFIEFDSKGATWIPFWKAFPEIVREYRIDGDFFLLMELDIWFHEPILSLPQRTNEIINHVPLFERHSMMVGGQIYHYRTWEGANLFYGEIIRRAIEDGIKFWNVPPHIYPYFFEKNRSEWEEKLGGEIGLYRFYESDRPDTMDEMCFYCPMVHQTKAVFDNRAVHPRGAETVHWAAPKFAQEKQYLNLSTPDIKRLSREFLYLDPYLALAAFFLSGDYETASRFEWSEMEGPNKDLLRLVSARYREWMDVESQKRLEELLALL